MKREKKIGLLLVLVVGILTLNMSCGLFSTSIQIGFLNTYDEGSATWNSYADKIERQEEKVNQILSDMGKSYSVDFQVVSAQAPVEAYDEYDLIEGPRIFNPSELQEHFRDLSDELENGALTPMYNSLPKDFWRTVVCNGAIYTIYRPDMNRIHSVRIPDSLLKQTGVTVPNELIGRPLVEWEGLFEEIYKNSGKRAFIMSPFTNSFMDPILSGNVWESHFQLITPALGIACDGSEKEVECVFESDYAVEMEKMWKHYLDKGFIISDNGNLSSEEIGWIRDNAVASCAGHDGKIFKLDETMSLYPLQEQIPNMPMYSTIKQHWQVIPKGGKHFEELCLLLNDLSTDDALREIICVSESEETTNIYLTEKSRYYGDWGTMLTGNVKENEQTMISRVSNLKEPPASGFVFDPSIVEEKVAKMEKVLEDYQLIFVSMNDTNQWALWEKYMDKLLNELYDAGMQDVMDEANRQLASYFENRTQS